MGTQSAGKSSLLENITKCAIFPRSEGFCTKMPVILQLTTAEGEEQAYVEVQHGDEK